MKILIAGDSFAADWSLKYSKVVGWPNMLAKSHSVTNVAQAGVSEYKILKQIESINLFNFDAVIVSHTCFSRVHTYRHPTLSRDVLHSNCDLIISDVFNKKEVNESMQAAWGYFKYHWDETYYRDLYNIFRDKIDKRLMTVQKSIQINNFEPIISDLSYRDLLKSHPGNINHFNEEGNLRIFKDVLSHLRS